MSVVACFALFLPVCDCMQLKRYFLLPKPVKWFCSYDGASVLLSVCVFLLQIILQKVVVRFAQYLQHTLVLLRVGG